MTFDQAQSPRLGQRTQVESTSVQMFSGGEVPEAAWPGQLIYINEEQILQVYNGDSWENVTGGKLGQLTFIGSTIPLSQNIGDVWFNTADGNRMYVARMVGADQVYAGEWEMISSTPPPITPTTHIYTQSGPPTAASSPPPKENDFWYETPINKQYFYQAAAPGNHWVLVRDTGIDAAAQAAAAASSSAAAANTAAANAMTAAQQAQATADGSIVTYYQTDPPWKVMTPAVDQSFEVGVNGYLLTGSSPAGSSISSDATRARTGTKSLKLTGGSVAGVCATQKLFTGITAGKTYTVLGWGYAPTGITAGGASMSIRIGGTTVAAAYNTPANATRDAWTPITTSYTAVASGTLTQYFYGSYGIGESTWWDDAVVVEGTITPNNIGDMWYDTDDNKAYRWSGVDWAVITDTQITTALEAAKTAQTTADGKITAYYQTSQPAVGKLGDLWYATADKNKPYYCSKESPLTWTIVRDGTIADAQAAADNAIVTQVVEYSVHSSETVAPTTGWSTNAPIRTPGSFIWTRTTTTKGNGSSATTNPVLLTGNTGLSGAQGSQGIPGPSGTNGVSLYTWLKYADTPTTGMSDFPAGKTYMGIAYNQASATESTSYGAYDWSLIQGPQGNTGIQGPAGSNGQPTYTWIKYADTVLGAGLADLPAGKAYIGLAYNKTTSAESTIPTDYEWALIQGPQGPAGQAGSQGIQGPAGPNGSSLYTWLKYADTPTTGMSDFPAGKTYMGIAYNQANATESTSYGVYDWSLIQGPQGNTGVAGPAGADGQPRYTWIKYADSVLGAGLNDSPVGKTYIGFAYNKLTSAESTITTDYEWALIQGPQGSQGIQGPKGADGVQLYTWLKYADTPSTGMNDSPVGKTYMGLAYNKNTATESTVYTDYDWSLIVGPSGAQGVQGVQGPVGPNGQPTYTWIKYATSSTGAGINDSPVGMSYIGIAYNKTTAVESTITTDYQWSLILGPQGSQGVQGPKGADGVQLYTWVKYADTPTTGMSDFPAGKAYMGIAYNKTVATEDNVNYNVYDWSLIVGPQGNTGVAGPAGANGQPTYTWIKYADSVTGAGISDSPVGKTYLGLAYNQTTAVEQSTPGPPYEWSLIQGPQGATGPTGPTGPPGLPGAAAAPPASPALTITPQDNGFVLQTGPIDIYSNLSYYCSSAGPNFVPAAGNMVLGNTRNQNVLITAQYGGAAFVRGTTYYFKVIEANNIGAAAASAQVSGQLRVWSKTDIPDLASAVTDSTNALLNAATAQTAANNALQQDSLSSNPIFNSWPNTAGARPDGWTTHTPTANMSRETTLVRTPPYAVRFNVLPVTQTYLAAAAGGAWSTLPNLEYITVTFDFMLVSGDLNNAGAMIRWVQDVSFKVVYIALNSSFTSGPPTLGQWYRVTRTIQRPALSGAFVRIDPYLCGGYSLIEAGSVTAKDIIFDQFSVRPSTAEEITAYNVPGTVAKATTDMQSYVQSRAYNLVTNGSGALGNNTNFSAGVFTSADAPTGASGSFVWPSTGTLRTTDELIPVDPSKVYEIAFDYRQVSGSGNFYGLMQPYDAYGLSISPTHVCSQANTLTTLAADLNPGDTKITLTSAANWNNTSGTTHLRSMIPWNYVDQGGKAWPANTYSRNWSGADTWAIGGITGNVITLKVPWAGSAIPSGTPVSNGMSGGAYMYMAARNVAGQATWTHYSERTLKGAMAGGYNVNPTNQFPIPTAKVKVGFLTNQTPTNCVQACSNVAFTEVTAGDDAAVLAQTALTSANGKNKVNYGSVAPTATSPGFPGDIWWVRTGNTITGQHLCTVGTGTTSGNTWVAQTLTSTTISTLDAGAIQSGYINSARIDVNSLNVGQISGLASTLGTLYEMTPLPTLTANSPVALSIAWNAFTIKHGGVTISVPAGNTANSWVIYRWKAGVPIIEQSDDQPVLANDDYVLFANNNGVGIRIFNTVLVSGDMIVDGSISANAIGAHQISADHLEVDAIDASMIRSGTLDSTVVMAGTMSVGDGIKIDPTSGITVVGPSGKSSIPSDGSGMVLSGDLTASSLTISGVSKMGGIKNEITNGGSLTLQAAQTPPASYPTIVSEWPTHAIPNLGDPNVVGRFRGLVQFPAEDATTWLCTTSDFSHVASIVKLTKQANGDFLEPPMRFDMRALRPEIMSVYGGLTVIGSDVYTLGITTEKIPSKPSNYRWYVYKWHYTGVASPAQSRFTYVTRWLFEPSTNYGGYSTQPGIGTDGTEILIYQSNANDDWGMCRYSSTGTYLGRVPLYQDAAHTILVNADRVGQQVVVTPADLGGPALWWVMNQDYAWVYCFDTTGTRIQANEFPTPGLPVMGFWWDGTRFMMHNGEYGSQVFDFSRIKDTDLVTNPVRAVQTWRLNNDADTGGQIGDYATFETAASPPASYTNLKKRSYFRINSPGPIPDDPNEINDPDSLSFYIGRGATPTYRRVTPWTGANKALTSVLLDTLPAVDTTPPPPAIPSSGSFPTAGVTPAVVKSSAGGGTPNWQFQGDGSWDLVPLGSHSMKSTATLAQKYDTGWQELTAASGWTKTVARWRRIGSLVSCEVNMTNNVAVAVTAQGSITNQYITAAMPTEILPKLMNCHGMMAIGTGGGLGVGYVCSVLSAGIGQVGIASADATGTARSIVVGTIWVGTFTWMV